MSRADHDRRRSCSPEDRPREALVEPDTSAGQAGPHDTLSIDAVLALFSALPFWEHGRRDAQALRIHGAQKILTWLATFPGTGWQQRWRVSGADNGKTWIDELIADDPRSVRQKRSEISHGLACLLACRVVMPGYAGIPRPPPRSALDGRV